AGEWRAAIAAFEKSRELRKSSTCTGYDGFVLAMAHWQLGEKEEARKWYDQTAQWVEKHPPPPQHVIRRFRAEAEELMKITDLKPTTKPESCDPSLLGCIRRAVAVPDA